MSVGMPRPSSSTCTEPSACSVTSTRRGVTGDALVGGVVEDLVDEVTDATAVGRPDVHAGPLADRVQPLEVGEVVGPVQGLGLCGHLVVLPVVADVPAARQARQIHRTTSERSPLFRRATQAVD